MLPSLKTGDAVMSLKIVLLVVAAGGAGTFLRCLIVRAFPLSMLPWGTLTVNVTGSFLAGLLFVLMKQRFPSLEPYAPVFLIGFLGAFTTFSTLALESANMLIAGEYGRAALNILIQNASGIAAVFCGICAGRLI